MDVGTTLRDARERRQLTLAQLASTTKIPVGILQALEANDFDKVPRGIFVRGFLRAYAAEVGLDADDIVAEFLRETDGVDTATASPPADVVAIDDQLHRGSIDPDLSSAGPGWGYLLMVAALLAAFIGLTRFTGDPEEDLAAAGAVELAVAGETTAARADLVDAVATAGQTVPAVADAAAADAAMLRFDLQANAECWVEAFADGRRVVYRLMRPGERETIESSGEIVLRVGDPGALTYRVNGEPGEPLGRPGIPVTVRFTNSGA